MPRLADQIRAVTNAALSELDPIWTSSASVDAIIDTLHDVMPALIDTWSLAAAALAAEWYDDLREIRGVKGRFAAIVAELGDKGAAALVGWATELLRQDVPDFDSVRTRLEGGAQRRIADAARETVMNSSIADPQGRGWQRIVSGPESCGFCIMLAARGGVYTEKTSRFGAHDNCSCSASPVWVNDPVKVDAYRPSEKNITDAERKATREWIEKTYPGHEKARLKRKAEAAN